VSKLKQVAASMRQTLAGSQARFVHCRLQRGLEVVLERREERLRLALGRMDAPPSDVEIELCQQAFAAPPDCDVRRLVKWRNGKGGPVTYHVAELTWREVI
jgi:hypothetical protein